MSTTVSVIIPCYNEEKYLPACLKSLAKQTRPADEIILCDNNSTDQTTKIIKNFASVLPIKYVFEPQKGIINAVQTAWQASQGDLIVRTDADCIFSPSWLTKIINHFDTDPLLAACGGPCRSLENNLLMKLLMRLAYPLSDLYYLSRFGFQLLPGANCALRQSVIKSLGGYQSQNNKNFTEDVLLSYRLHQQGFRAKRFPDCYNYTSTRRFSSNPKEICLAVLGTLNPSFYKEKI